MACCSINWAKLRLSWVSSLPAKCKRTRFDDTYTATSEAIAMKLKSINNDYPVDILKLSSSLDDVSSDSFSYHMINSGTGFDIFYYLFLAELVVSTWFSNRKVNFAQMQMFYLIIVEDLSIVSKPATVRLQYTNRAIKIQFQIKFMQLVFLDSLQLSSASVWSCVIFTHICWHCLQDVWRDVKRTYVVRFREIEPTSVRTALVSNGYVKPHWTTIGTKTKTLTF